MSLVEWLESQPDGPERLAAARARRAQEIAYYQSTGRWPMPRRSPMSKYRKALVAAVIAGLGALTLALGDGVLTLLEGIGVLSAALAALGGTYAVPNTPAPEDRPLSGRFQ